MKESNCQNSVLHCKRTRRDFLKSKEDSPNYSGQAEWRWCRKCQALSFAGGDSLGACPAGGSHDNSSSGNYILQER